MNSLGMNVAKMDCHFFKFLLCVSVSQSYIMTEGIPLMQC